MRFKLQYDQNIGKKFFEKIKSPYVNSKFFQISTKPFLIQINKGRAKELNTI